MKGHHCTSQSSPRCLIYHVAPAEKPLAAAPAEERGGGLEDGGGCAAEAAALHQVVVFVSGGTDHQTAPQGPGMAIQTQRFLVHTHDLRRLRLR